MFEMYPILSMSHALAEYVRFLVCLPSGLEADRPVLEFVLCNHLLGTNEILRYSKTRRWGRIGDDVAARRVQAARDLLDWVHERAPGHEGEAWGRMPLLGMVEKLMA